MKTLKFTKLFSVSMLLTAVLFASCTKQPSANFSISNSNPNVDETVYFNNNSTDAKTYYWTFGDGETSTQENPSHVYSTSGIKTVTLTAYSKKEKKTDRSVATVNVKATGEVMFWTDSSTIYQITVTFKGTNQVITKYYTSTPSFCGASGCATFENIAPGTYSYYAENDLYYWSGNVTIEEDVCLKMLLYASKAEKKQNQGNQPAEVLTEGVCEAW